MIATFAVCILTAVTVVNAQSQSPMRENKQRRSAAKSTATEASESTAGECYPFPYNDSSVHTFTVYYSSDFLDDGETTGGYGVIANPDGSSTFYKTTFKGYMEYSSDIWWLHAVTDLVMYGEVVIPADDYCIVENKSEFAEFELEYNWPDKVQSVFSDGLMKNYYFVNLSEPDSILLWGLDTD